MAACTLSITWIKMRCSLESRHHLKVIQMFFNSILSLESKHFPWEIQFVFCKPWNLSPQIHASIVLTLQRCDLLDSFMEHVNSFIGWTAKVSMIFFITKYYYLNIERLIVGWPFVSSLTNTKNSKYQRIVFEILPMCREWLAAKYNAHRAFYRFGPSIVFWLRYNPYIFLWVVCAFLIRLLLFFSWILSSRNCTIHAYVIIIITVIIVRSETTRK